MDVYSCLRENSLWVRSPAPGWQAEQSCPAGWAWSGRTLSPPGLSLFSSAGCCTGGSGLHSPLGPPVPPGRTWMFPWRRDTGPSARQSWLAASWWAAGPGGPATQCCPSVSMQGCQSQPWPWRPNTAHWSRTQRPRPACRTWRAARARRLWGAEDQGPEWQRHDEREADIRDVLWA